jgi:hypothetical protein
MKNDFRFPELKYMTGIEPIKKGPHIRGPTTITE